MLFLFNCGEIKDFIRDPTLRNFKVRGFNESKIIDPRITCEGGNQTDIGTFRSFNRTDPTIMRSMDVPDIKTCPFSGQTSRPQCTESPFMCDLRKRIGLVHELRKLAAAEELMDRTCNRFGIDDIMQHHRLRILERHAFFDRPFHSNQPNSKLGFKQFADTSDPPVSEMINVINHSVRISILQLQQVFNPLHDVIMGQSQVIQGIIQTKFLVDFETTHFGKAVAFLIEKEILQHRLRCFQGRRIPRFHFFIDLNHGLFRTVDLIHLKSVSKTGADISWTDAKKFHFSHPMLNECHQ